VRALRRPQVLVKDSTLRHAAALPCIRPTVQAAVGRLGLTLLASENLAITGSTVARFRITNGRSPAEIIRALPIQLVAVAQPNYVYTLQQQGGEAAPASRGDPGPRRRRAIHSGRDVRRRNAKAISSRLGFRHPVWRNQGGVLGGTTGSELNCGVNCLVAGVNNGLNFTFNVTDVTGSSMVPGVPDYAMFYGTGVASLTGFAPTEGPFAMWFSLSPQPAAFGFYLVDPPPAPLAYTPRPHRWRWTAWLDAGGRLVFWTGGEVVGKSPEHPARSARMTQASPLCVLVCPESLIHEYAGCSGSR
jgi:hypothetical protein